MRAAMFRVRRYFALASGIAVGRIDRILRGQYVSLHASEEDLRAKSVELQVANERMRMAAGVFRHSLQGIVIVDAQLNAVEINGAYIRAIVEATIALAHSLGLTVVAEGVETEAQLEFLRGAGCRECQGYLFSAPVPPGRFARILDGSEALRGASPAFTPLSVR